MSDQNNSLDIYIRMITQQTGEKPEAVLKKLKEQITETGKEGVKQEEAVTAATKETIKTKEKLQEQVRDTGKGVVAMAREAINALNPLTIIIGAAGLAFGIWQFRVGELVRSLGGLKMPEFKETDIERVHRVATAYEKLAEKLLASGTNAKGINTQLTLANKAIDANDAFKKALGLETGTKADEAKNRQMVGAADALLRSGTNKLKAAGKFNPDNAAAGDLEKAAKAAELEKVGIQGRIADISHDLDPELPWYKKIYYQNRFRARYGYSATGQDAIGMENSNLAQQEAVIGRFANRTMAQTGSDALRKSGTADLAARDEILAKLTDALYKIAANQAAGGAGALNRVNPMDNTMLADMVAQTGQLATNAALLAQSLVNMKRANDVLQMQVNANNQR